LSRIGKLLEAAFGKVIVRLRDSSYRIPPTKAPHVRPFRPHATTQARRRTDVEVGALHAMLKTHRESKPDEAPLETDADSSKSERAADVRAKNDPEK